MNSYIKRLELQGKLDYENGILSGVESKLKHLFYDKARLENDIKDCIKNYENHQQLVNLTVKEMNESNHEGK